MLSIKEIRAKYPDYDDLSDQQLIDSIHAKHYADIPKEEFYSKIGLAQSKMGVDQNDPSFLAKTAQYLKSDTANVARNLLTGYLNMGRNLANTPHNIANKFGYGNVIPNFAPTSFDYGAALGLKKENENKLIQAIPELATSLAIPGSTVPRMIAGQAVFGATQNEDPLMGAVLGGAGAAAGAGAGKLLEASFNKLRPSNLFKSNLSDEQLIQNVMNTAGTETPLGDVIGSPSLKRLSENILPHVLGSGAEQSAQRTAKKIVEKGESLLSEIRGGQPIHENYGVKIRDALQAAAEAAKKEKTAKFNKVNKIAEENKIQTTRDNLRKEAQEILKEIKEDKHLASFTNASDISLLEKIIKKPTTKELTESKIIDPITNKPFKSKKQQTTLPAYSLKKTDILKGKIGENAYEATTKGEAPKAQIYTRLKQALEKDVKEAIENSSNTELKQAHKQAMDYYKTEYAPFKDKDVMKFISSSSDPDLLLNHFVRIGKADRSHILQKLRLGKEKGSLVGSAYLSPAYENGELNPVKLNTLYHKLGTRQKLELFGKENNRQLKQYLDLVNKNKEGFNLMFNPKTGARLGHIGSIAAAAAHLPSALTLSALGRGANKLLTSESFRNKLVNAMIANKQTSLPKTINTLKSLGAVSAN